MVNWNQPRIYIVGDRPGPNTDPKRPLFPHTTTGAAQKLIDLMGVSVQWYLENTVRMNAWHDGERLLTKHEAIPRLDGMFAYMTQEKPVSFLIICLGDKARQIFPRDILSYAPGESGLFLDNVEIVYIPHTSGVNRFWNDPLKANWMRTRLRQMLAVSGLWPAAPEPVSEPL